ncbi:hypothetical protein D3C80_1243720 [compost metagenome]
MCQFPHLLRDDGKASSGFASAGSLHTGIESKEIGLESNLVNDADDAANLLRRPLNTSNRCNRIIQKQCCFLSIVSGLFGNVLCLRGTICREADIGRQLIQCCGRFFQ